MIAVELCACPDCGAPAEVLTQESYDAWPGDTVRVQCVERHWFLGPRRPLRPRHGTAGAAARAGTVAGR